MDTSSAFQEDTERGSDEELQPSNNNEDRVRSDQEQLAELQLLTRVDLQSPTSSFTTPPNGVTESSAPEEGSDTQLDEGESNGRPRVATGGLSSFTAILATSRKIATSSSDQSAVFSNALASENGVPVAPLDQTSGLLAIETSERPRSPKAFLPTLNEGAEGEEDDEDDEIPATPSVVISTSFVNKLSSSSAAVVPATELRQEQEPEEPNTDDSEFAEMLEHLSQGNLDILALTPDDLTVRKLERVHAAMSKAQTSTPTMSFVRALVSVDMLQLLLQRLGMRAVRDAVSRTTQHAFEREETASELGPVVLLTSTNIATVVLEVRNELTAPEANTVSPPPQIPDTSSKHHVRRGSQTSSRSSSSPSSSVSSSPRCGTPRSLAADRRSILAKEGVHVLMQEKLVSFDHRGQANALPAFRVRGASAALTDSAAKRRQRGLQYANDHISHRIVHM